MIEVKAPHPFKHLEKFSIFLAGSIEMGMAEMWQEKFCENAAHLDIVVLNPRRDDWNSSWEQCVTNNVFREQVEWELAALDHATIILMYLQPETFSPVSLLELGLYASHAKVVVCCPDGFWRKGNVDMVCKKYEIPVFDRKEDMFDAVISRIVPETLVSFAELRCK
jgi:hypothetical protein